MTNKEMLIEALKNFESPEGGYISEEDYITDYLVCPYYRDQDCINDMNSTPYDTREWATNCQICKQEWLGKEFAG